MISSRIAKKLGAGAAPIRAAFNEAERQRALYGSDAVYDLSIGNPGAPMDAAVRDAIRETALSMEEHGYMCEAGYEWVRANIAASLSKRFGTPYSAGEIVMTAGAAGALNAVLCALLDAGDEVVVIRPYYPPYVSFIENWGGVPIAADSDLSDFQPDFASLKKKITRRTKAVIVNSPNNPSGAVYTRETAERMSELLKNCGKRYGTDIYLISDEPYRELVYTGEELPVWAEYYGDSLMVYSFSKSLSLAGERIGYAAVSPYSRRAAELTSAIRAAIGVCGYVNAPAFFQGVVGKCADIAPNLNFYTENRRLLYSKLLETGFDAQEPQGAFYIFVKSPLPSERDFIEAAARRHLIFVGGSAFGCPGYARLSFCGKRSVISGAMKALELLAGDCGLRGGL
ncbi:pyridoxal phosphate-dependent aminotransferase [Cloacibacillus sp. An23]|uniref:pyridoxal phosphate-dependent aminotransferase n=1 Tax=Cloacibacillus sp. An23 TaxID=1965591 RepID=UPI000B37BE80|nr:pyridoxal phosphate-dependent aminotransferase [Cloacibacillus sp. An23]OUO95119.1 hypothetical protein B5F39_00900 [Cloacibacillus sp. An23]